MKRYIHLSSNIDVEKVIEQTFGSSNPGTGCTFISSNGTFINIYPELDVHEDLCEWVSDNLGIDIKYPDEEYFVRNYRWIRLRSDPGMMIIELPNERPSNAQWYSLEDWLYYCEDKYSGRKIKLSINICDDVPNTDVPFAFGSEYFAEDIMKILKRYYTSGKIYATTNSYLTRIPKKYRKHIVSIEVSDSDDYNSRGQRLKDYTVTWDNGDEHTFQNVEYMIWAIKNNTDGEGYYIES